MRRGLVLLLLVAGCHEGEKHGGSSGQDPLLGTWKPQDDAGVVEFSERHVTVFLGCNQCSWGRETPDLIVVKLDSGIETVQAELIGDAALRLSWTEDGGLLAHDLTRWDVPSDGGDP